MHHICWYWLENVIMYRESGQSARGHFEEQNRRIGILVGYTETWWTMTEQIIDATEKLTDAENVPSWFNRTKQPNVTSQFRPRTPGLVHVEERGASTKKKSKFLSTSSERVPANFNQSTSSTSWYLIEWRLLSGLWQSLWTTGSSWLHIRTLIQKKARPILDFFELVHNIFDVSREACCYFIIMWSMSQDFWFFMMGILYSCVIR